MHAHFVLSLENLVKGGWKMNGQQENFTHIHIGQVRGAVHFWMLLQDLIASECGEEEKLRSFACTRVYLSLLHEIYKTENDF